jgi:hypothetical protein
MARTPWGRRPSYGSELAKRKLAVDESKKCPQKKKVNWVPFLLAAGAFFVAFTNEEATTYALIIGIGALILGIYWASK